MKSAVIQSQIRWLQVLVQAATIVRYRSRRHRRSHHSHNNLNKHHPQHHVHPHQAQIRLLQSQQERIGTHRREPFLTTLLLQIRQPNLQSLQHLQPPVG